MKRKIDIKTVFLSIGITMLLTYILPSHYISEGQKSFGCPIGWLTIFHDTIGDVLLNSTLVNPISLFINFVFWYLISFWLINLYKKLRKNNNA